MDEDSAVAALAALAQTMRLRVFRALVGAGPAGLTPGALSGALGVPSSTLSFHLKELLAAGLLTQERQSRHLIYRPSIDRMSGLMAYLVAHCCDGAGPQSCTAAPPAGSGAAAEPDGDVPAATLCSPGDAMSEKIYDVLFICTHNSARSIMAEGLLNSLGRGRFKAHSAGSHPRGVVHPLALKTLAGLHIPGDGYRSKDWNEFAAAGAPTLDFVFTVCDQAAGETCPVWPGQPMTAHWGVPDPSAFEGSDAQKVRFFLDTAIVLKRRIELMLALPLDTLDRLAIQRQITDIGTR